VLDGIVKVIVIIHNEVTLFFYMAAIAGLLLLSSSSSLTVLIFLELLRFFSLGIIEHTLRDIRAHNSKVFDVDISANQVLPQQFCMIMDNGE